MERLFVIFCSVLLLKAVSGAFGIVVDHECYRPCTWPPEPKTCRYVFTVEWFQSMSAACYDCPFNQTDCDRPGCIPINGIQRPLVVINRQLPGPQIQVCEEDTVEVKVWNRLGNAEGTTIHWHGIHQRGTPFMDGANMVSQCPISPQASFTYKFKASQAGTQWWHSHANLQRQDGAFGALIVKQATERDIHSTLYDNDLPEHVVFVHDWHHDPTITRYAAFPPYAIGADALLINAKGVFRNFTKDGKTKQTSREVFNVEHGKRYRFRVIGNINICHLVVSVQGHSLTAIATDGLPIEPIEVKRIGIASGERYDFVLTADQEIGNYWFRIYTEDPGCPFAVKEQLAILHYEGAPEQDPLKTFSSKNGFLLNPPPFDPAFEDDSGVNIMDLKSAVPDEYTLLHDDPDVRHYLIGGIHLKPRWNFYDPEDYSKPPVSDFPRDIRQFNHVSFKVPPSPLLSQLKDVPEKEFCDADERLDLSLAGDRCTEEYCNCINRIKIQPGQVVEVVLIGEDFYHVDHPVHLHGYSFRVVGMGKFKRGITSKEIIQMDQQGNRTRTLEGAVIKDTVIVPADGYTIIRFVADNPGWWLLHCHFAYHLEDGMAVVFQDADPSIFPPIPHNFPKCGSWSYDDPQDDDDIHIEKERKDGGHLPPKRRKGTK